MNFVGLSSETIKLLMENADKLSTPCIRHLILVLYIFVLRNISSP